LARLPNNQLLCLHFRNFPNLSTHEDKAESIAQREDASNMKKEGKNGNRYNAYSLFSGLYALIVVLLMLVLKTTQFVTNDVSVLSAAVPSPRGDLVGLAPPNKAPSPQIET